MDDASIIDKFSLDYILLSIIDIYTATEGLFDTFAIWKISLLSISLSRRSTLTLKMPPRYWLISLALSLNSILFNIQYFTRPYQFVFKGALIS